MKEQQQHILIGCSDARDLSMNYMKALIHSIQYFNSRGIQIDFHKIRTPGAIITSHTIEDIRNLVESHQRNIWDKKCQTKYFIHIQSHGELAELPSTPRGRYFTHEVSIVPNSPLNCGMLSATSVALELEKEILISQPLIYLPNRETLVIDSEIALRRTLREVYAFDGYFAGDWVKNIDDLRTHPRKQKIVLENAIHKDPVLNSLGIVVTANIIDYHSHQLVHLKSPEENHVEFWAYFKEQLDKLLMDKPSSNDLEHQDAQQLPLAGLICVSPTLSSRMLAKNYYLKLKDLEEKSSIANTLFQLRAPSFDLPFVPFGPYHIVGYYYSIKHLNIKEYMVLGVDDSETKRVIKKIQNDPIMNFITEKYKIHLLPVNYKDLQQVSPVWDEKIPLEQELQYKIF